MKVELEKIKFWNADKKTVTFDLTMMDVPHIKVKRVKLEIKDNGIYRLYFPYTSFMGNKNRKIYYNYVEMPFSVKDLLVKCCAEYLEKLKEEEIK